MTDKSEDGVLREAFYGVNTIAEGLRAARAAAREIDAAKAKPAVEPRELWEVALGAYWQSVGGAKSEKAVWQPVVDAIKAELKWPDHSRNSAKSAENELRAALRKLTFMARTSGGVGGRDEALCAACDEAEAILERPEPKSAGPNQERFLTDVADEYARATAKFPGNKCNVAALMEEVGELAQALLQLEFEPHKGKTVEDVYKEVVQVGAVATKIALHGSSEFPLYVMPPANAEPTHYIHHNGHSVFVKEAGFFRDQGGLVDDWGAAWRPVIATSIEHARTLWDAPNASSQLARRRG